MTALACSGCGATVPLDEPHPFRCPNAGRGNVDHVLSRGPTGAAFPGGEAAPSANPFVRYRELLHPYRFARARGLSDDDYTSLVARLDDAVAAVDGKGFRATPLTAAPELAARLVPDGEVWIKDETGNVSGSHKARHLFGILVQLEVAGDPRDRPLAIASCGNAALAAAVVARAAQRPLEVFIPPSANPSVVARLAALGARTVVCPRPPGASGDPCYHRFRAAVDAGALPFACQGPDNALTIEGGRTLAYELVAELGGRPLDRLFIQVGGGALASACVQALREAAQLGALARMPRVHAVQTAGAWPLARAYHAVAARILLRLTDEPAPDDDAVAARIAAAPPALVDEELRFAASHRGTFMRPWETEPVSIAHGILDDETYDWLAIVRAMLESGGSPLVVDEPTLASAHRLGRSATAIDVDPTGAAGLAGALALRPTLAPTERLALIFSGAER